MTQEQYNTIVKLVQNGAPALSDELVPALQGLVVGYQKLLKENEELRKQLTPDASKQPVQEGGK